MTRRRCPAASPPCNHAGLRTLATHSSGLARLPPALAAASALEEMHLEHNPHLAVTPADANRLLATCRSLRKLCLSCTPAHDELMDYVLGSAQHARLGLRLAGGPGAAAPLQAPWMVQPPHFEVA